MTKIVIALAFSNGQPLPFGSRIEFTPTGKYWDDETLILPATERVTADGAAEVQNYMVELDPTGLSWSWRVDITIPGHSTATEYVLVPDTENPVDFVTLDRVNPETLETAEPDPEWWAQLKNGLKSAKPGPQGERGEKGDKGDRGNVGLRGEIGPIGPVGPIGATGPQGPTGKTGATGKTGLTPNISIGEVRTTSNPSDSLWLAQLIRDSYADVNQALKDTFPSTMKGDKGDIGPQGPVGERGPQGIQGIQGVKGDTGVGWVGTSVGEAHLDTLLTPGLYYQNSTPRITPEKGYPPGITSASGRCSVRVYPWGGTGAIMQEISTVGSSTRPSLTATRYVENGNFQAWSIKVSQRVDNTAGRAIYTWDDTANREQLIYGNTGWRVLTNTTDILINGFSCTSMICKREGYLVTLNFDSMKSAESGHVNFVAMPPGFRHDVIGGMGNHRYGVATELSGANPTVISPESSTSAASLNGLLRFLHYPANRVLHGTVTYYTRDPWPTELPGTPVGIIPNA